MITDKEMLRHEYDKEQIRLNLFLAQQEKAFREFEEWRDAVEGVQRRMRDLQNKMKDLEEIEGK